MDSAEAELGTGRAPVRRAAPNCGASRCATAAGYPTPRSDGARRRILHLRDRPVAALRQGALRRGLRRHRARHRRRGGRPARGAQAAAGTHFREGPALAPAFILTGCRPASATPPPPARSWSTRPSGRTTSAALRGTEEARWRSRRAQGPVLAGRERVRLRRAQDRGATSSTRPSSSGLLPGGRRADPALRERSASTSSTTRCARATRPSARRLLREPVLSAHNDYTDWSGPNRVRELLPTKVKICFEAVRHHSGLARDQPADPVQPARHRRRQERRARRPADRRAPLSAPRRADVPAEVQPAPPLVLLPADAPRRGAGVQGVRLGEGRPCALHAAHSFEDPTTPPGAPPRQSIGARRSFFLGGGPSAFARKNIEPRPASSAMIVKPRR